MDKINILGVNINDISQAQILNKIQEFLHSQTQHFIVTPNPEIILEATGKDEELHYILNHADIALADGIALKFAGWFYGKNIKRITGADLTYSILKLAEEKKYRVAVFNWKDGLSSAVEIKSAVYKKFPKLGLYVEAINRNELNNFSAVNQFAPDIIFCTLGAPYQEKFVYYNLVKIPSAKLGLSVGGSFDFLTGKTKRAPKGLRIIGLEWLWRLIKQPKRGKRIYKAVIVFPFRFFIFFFILPRRYRPNIACWLFKRENGIYKVLIVERVGEKAHWQLPQGGIDGESLLVAGARELREELNTENFKPVAVFKNLFKYGFNKYLDKNVSPAKNQRGYKGQKQSLFIAEFSGQDSDIKINFWEHGAWKWVEVDKFLETIAPIRREAGEIYLRKFKEAVKK